MAVTKKTTKSSKAPRQAIRISMTGGTPRNRTLIAARLVSALEVDGIPFTMGKRLLNVWNGLDESPLEQFPEGASVQVNN